MNGDRKIFRAVEMKRYTHTISSESRDNLNDFDKKRISQDLN